MKKVLVLEDEKMVAKALQSIIEHFGFHVWVAHSGLEALDKAKEETFDFFLFDINIPGGMDGVATIQKIREVHSAGKAIAMSGFEFDVLQHPENYGFSAALRKPFDLQEVVAVLS